MNEVILSEVIFDESTFTEDEAGQLFTLNESHDK